MRGPCDGPDSAPLSHLRNRRRLLRHRLEQGGHHALPVADKKHGCGRTNSVAPDARRRVRRANAGGDRGGRRGEALFFFEGEETDFSGFKLDLGEQDPFFKRVYAAARRVGWGRTTTYGTLAKELGAGPEAARDVGQAMAKNPVALIIPCHRVLAAGGKVGGFSAPGGSAAKIRMLALEGVHLEPRRPAQQSFGF